MLDSYTTLALANSIVERTPGCYNRNSLHRLVFIIQGWCLAMELSLFDELPLVGDNGPLYLTLDKHLASYVDEPILYPHAPVFWSTPKIAPNDRFLSGLIDKVLLTYGQLSPNRLAVYCVSPFSPWASSYRSRQEQDDYLTINPLSMAAYYKERMVEGYPGPRPQDMIADISEIFPLRSVETMEGSFEPSDGMKTDAQQRNSR